jgi:hypothetical protein
LKAKALSQAGSVIPFDLEVDHEHRAQIPGDRNNEWHESHEWEKKNGQGKFV